MEQDGENPVIAELAADRKTEGDCCREDETDKAQVYWLEEEKFEEKKEDCERSGKKERADSKEQVQGFGGCSRLYIRQSLVCYAPDCWLKSPNVIVFMFLSRNVFDCMIMRVFWLFVKHSEIFLNCSKNEDLYVKCTFPKFLHL